MGIDRLLALCIQSKPVKFPEKECPFQTADSSFLWIPVPMIFFAIKKKYASNWNWNQTNSTKSYMLNNLVYRIVTAKSLDDHNSTYRPFTLSFLAYTLSSLQKP